jgi:AcrR family transcriptional regulator
MFSTSENGPVRRIPGVGRRSHAERKAATRSALQAAGLRLFAEKGFDRTTTDDIAKAAGVSPRTFFNYFTSKDSVAQIPRALLTDNLRDGLLSRPLGEAPATSMAAATTGVFEAIVATAGPIGLGLLRTGVRMMSRFPQMQRRAWERRAELETIAWETLQERGIRADDLAARTTVTIVISVGWQALMHWSQQDVETLPAVFTRALLESPNPEQYAVAADDTELAS